jgi:hypothetical protein
LIIFTLKKQSAKEQAMEKVAQETEKSIVNAIRINEKEVGDHLNRLVR